LSLFQVTAPSELHVEDVDDESQVESNERHPSLVTPSLFLGVLVKLSERRNTVSRTSSRGAVLAAECWGGGWGCWLGLGQRETLSLIQARKMTAFLPHIVEMLQHDDPDVMMKVLELFRNVQGHLTRDEAGPIAVLLEEQLPPLFEHVRLMGEPVPRR